MKPQINFGIILLSLFFSFCIKTNAQSPSYQWVKAIGGTSYDIGNAIAVDQETGNVYTTGVFSGTVDFDPGAGIFNLTSAGDHDIFILKSNTNGHFVWAKSVGGLINDAGFSIAVDASGDIYVTGQFNRTVDFDPGEEVFTLTSAGLVDIFILKLDSSGNFIWAKAIGGEGYDVGKALAVDPSGSEAIYIKGEFSGTVDFDPGSDTFNLTASRSSNGIFISKLDSFGNFVWAESIGEVPNVGSERMALYCGFGKSIIVNALGDVYTTGWFQGTVDFDPGSGIYNLTATGINDIFILKLDAAGKFLWALSMQGSPKGVGYKDVGQSLALDDSGNICITGTFQGTVDFDPGYGIHPLTSLGNTFGDIFISKLNSAGHFIWAKSFGGAGNESGNSIAVDKESGDIYTIGNYTGTVDFNPGKGIFNLRSAGDLDAYISKLDSSGNFVWAKSIGGVNADYGYSIALNSEGNIHVVGGFTGPSISFGLTTLPNAVSTRNHLDIFIAKLNVSLPASVVDSNEQQVVIYPNPVKDQLKIKFDEEVVNEVKVNLYNLNGEIVFSTLYKNSQELTLDVNWLPAAMYIIEVNADGNKIVKQIVKVQE